MPIHIKIQSNELAEGAIVRIEQDGIEAIVSRHQGKVVAWNAICPHLGGPLLEARHEGGDLVCPWHEYRFDLASGKCKTVPGEKWKQSLGTKQARDEPADLPLMPFRVEESDGEITITAPDPKNQSS